MALDAEQGKRMLQLLTSRYDDRHWRKKIEKTLSLPMTGGEVREALTVTQTVLDALASVR